jgi:imidazolonepropionase-like amidohydrolase
MKKTSCFIIIISLFIAFFVSPVSAADLLIKNARLIDATGALPQEGVSILIQDGIITAINDNVSAEGAQVLDVENATVLPGLIDSHVHLFFNPGAYVYAPAKLVDENGVFDMEYWLSTYGKYILQYLRAYLACGVTTVLDAAGPVDVVQKIRDVLTSGNPGPRFLPLGPGFTTPGGFQDHGGPNSISTIDGVKKHFDRLESLGTAGAKVFLQSRGGLPIFPAEIRDAIRDEAAKRNIPLYIHAMSDKDQITALAMNPHAIMHSNIYDKVSKEYIDKMVKSSVYQVTTLSIPDSSLAPYYPERFDDPLLDIVVPESELLFARDPESQFIVSSALLESIVPWLPKGIRNILTRYSIKANKSMFEEMRQRGFDNVKQLHDAGVKIVAGSDIPFSIWITTEFHGYELLREIELLGMADLEPMEAIRAGTINAAEMLGLDSEIGTVEVGKKADLMIVRDDPLEDLANLKTILYTVQAGVAKTPEQWMKQ